MAKSLEEQITAGLRPSSRIVDVERVIAEVEAQVRATTAEFETQTALSVNPALTVPQAREARNTAADLEHDLRRMAASTELLTARLQKLRDDGAYAARVERFQKARETRDALVAQILDRYPAIAEELIALVQRIAASDADIEAVNQSLPRGEKWLAGAEMEARGYAGAGYWSGCDPVVKLKDIRLPLMCGTGCYLPQETGHDGGRQYRLRLNEERQRVTARKAKQEAA